MKVLVACEESQRVCIAFRNRGHEAYSCDIQECSGGHPEWHIKGNVLPVLNPSILYQDERRTWYGIQFYTMDGTYHYIDGKWDLIIAHPPCTYFSNATMVNLGRKDHPEVFNEEWRQRFYKKRNDAFEFVQHIYNANCDRIAIENVVGYLSTHFMKPTQIIQPFYFGEPYRKATCLWLKGLPKLEATNIVKPTCKWVKHNLKTKNDLVGYERPGVLKAKDRSRTFEGIANAMAEQWQIKEEHYGKN